MVSAEISITLTEEFGLTAVSKAFPEAEFTYLAGIEEPDRGLGLVEVRGGELAAILERIRECESVWAFELLDSSEDRAVFQYETAVAVLYRAVRDSGIIPAFPYTIRDGTLYFQTVTTPDRLSRLGRTLRSLEIPIEVTTVAESVRSAGILTERQREVVVAALDCGYYETPRRSSLSDLADELAIAPSTASTILHRAEERVMKRYVREII